MATYTTLSSLFTAIANAIRSKTGGSASIVADNFPAAINSIQLGVDTSDANAVASDILSGKTAYVNGVKVTGNYIPPIAGTAFTFTGTGSSHTSLQNNNLIGKSSVAVCALDENNDANYRQVSYACISGSNTYARTWGKLNTSTAVSFNSATGTLTLPSSWYFRAGSNFLVVAS